MVYVYDTEMQYELLNTKFRLCVLDNRENYLCKIYAEVPSDNSKRGSMSPGCHRRDHHMYTTLWGGGMSSMSTQHESWVVSYFTM